MAGFLGSYADAYDTAERIDSNRLQQQRTYIADQTAARGRMERMKKADELRRQVGEGDAAPLPAPVDLPGGGATIATPAAPSAAAPAPPGRVTAPRSVAGIYANPSLLANQTESETRRLASKPLVSSVQQVTPERPLRVPGSWAPTGKNEAGRLAELRRLNPPGEGVGVKVLQGGSSTDQPAIDRLKAKDAAIRGNGGFESFKNAIFGQESGNGAVDTSQPNYAGARGKGQILESTFNGLKQAGKIPANWQWANPQHNEAAAVEYMKEAWVAGNGDPRLAAAYYYAGPKGIQNGQVATYRDLKNPNAPDTNQYASSILQRMGKVATAAVPAATAQAQTPQQFTPEQFFAAAPQVNEQARMASLRIDQLRRMAQIESDPAALQQLQGQLMQLQSGLREAQLYDLAARGNTDMGALSQLVQLAGVSVARTPQGFVEVDRSTGQAVGQPMSAGQLAQSAFQFLSAQARAQAAARSQKLFDAGVDTQGKIAVEGAKNAGNLQVEELKANAAATRALQELAAKDRSVEIKTTPEGQTFAIKGGRAFVYAPPRTVDGYATMGGFQEIPMPR